MKVNGRLGVLISFLAIVVGCFMAQIVGAVIETGGVGILGPADKSVEYTSIYPEDFTSSFVDGKESPIGMSQEFCDQYNKYLTDNSVTDSSITDTQIKTLSAMLDVEITHCYVVTVLPGMKAKYQTIIDGNFEDAQKAEAQYKIAQLDKIIFQLGGGSTADMIAGYQKVIDLYPTSPYYMKSLLKISDLYLAMGTVDGQTQGIAYATTYLQKTDVPFSPTVDTVLDTIKTNEILILTTQGKVVAGVTLPTLPSYNSAVALVAQRRTDMAATAPLADILKQNTVTTSFLDSVQKVAPVAMVAGINEYKQKVLNDEAAAKTKVTTDAETATFAASLAYQSPRDLKGKDLIKFYITTLGERNKNLADKNSPALITDLLKKIDIFMGLPALKDGAGNVVLDKDGNPVKAIDLEKIKQKYQEVFGAVFEEAKVDTMLFR